MATLSKWENPGKIGFRIGAHLRSRCLLACVHSFQVGPVLMVFFSLFQYDFSFLCTFDKKYSITNNTRLKTALIALNQSAS